MLDWTGYLALVAEAAGRFPLETGGILLGRWENGGRAVLTDVIGPGSQAIHEPTSFDPDQVWQEAEVARVWRDRGGQVAYLGDWHSHPGGSLRPSWLDVSTARRIAAAPAARAPRPILLVLSLTASGSVQAKPFVLGRVGRLVAGRLQVVRTE